MSRDVPLKVKSTKYSQKLPQPLPPGLDDKELQTLGLITSNWGHAEYVIGCCLMNFYEMKYETARDLLHNLDFSKKVDLLNKLQKSGNVSNEASILIKEIIYCNVNYKKHRNIYSHGLIIWDQPDDKRALITGKGEETDPEYLPLVLDQSIYTLMISIHLLYISAGSGMHRSLPERPHKLPDE